MAKHPIIIQGGMGVAVSSWQLARAVAKAGHLGVVSGTALDGVLARVLQDGDPGGHARRALAHFPSPAMAQRVLDAYFLEGGRAEGQPYRPHPTLTIAPVESERTTAPNGPPEFRATFSRARPMASRMQASSAAGSGGSGIAASQSGSRIRAVCSITRAHSRSPPRSEIWTNSAQ